MGYAHPGKFHPLKILDDEPLSISESTITIWLIRRWTVFSLSRPFIFLFRRVLPFIFLDIFIFTSTLLWYLLCKVLSTGRVSDGTFSTWVISGSSRHNWNEKWKEALIWLVGYHWIKISQSLTCVFLSTLNCEQIGKRTWKRWQTGIFGII